MVIRLLDDCTYYARCALSHLRLWQKLQDCSWHHFTTSWCSNMCPIDIFVDLRPVGRNENFPITLVWGYRHICPSDSPPVRSSDSDTMTNTALEANASSTGNNSNKRQRNIQKVLSTNHLICDQKQNNTLRDQ